MVMFKTYWLKGRALPPGPKLWRARRSRAGIAGRRPANAKAAELRAV